MRDEKTVFCDTSFFIRLLNADDPLHENALGYYRHFLVNGYEMYVSTIAVAEFCIRGKADNLPFENLCVSPFDLNHAILAGPCAKVLFDARSRGVVEFDHRIVITNDVKMMAQAQCEEADYYITSDSESRKMYDVLKEAEMVSFKFINLNDPYHSLTEKGMQNL